MQQLYKYNKADYDDKAFNKNGELFIDFIRKCEVEFNKEFNPFFANAILANHSTIDLMKNSFVITEPTDFGMDGDFNFDENIKINEHNEKELVVAVGQGANEDKQLFLVEDNSVSYGIVILKYISDNDDEVVDPIESVDIGSKVTVFK